MSLHGYHSNADATYYCVLRTQDSRDRPDYGAVYYNLPKALLLRERQLFQMPTCQPESIEIPSNMYMEIKAPQGRCIRGVSQVYINEMNHINPTKVGNITRPIPAKTKSNGTISPKKKNIAKWNGRQGKDVKYNALVESCVTRQSHRVWCTGSYLPSPLAAVRGPLK